MAAEIAQSYRYFANRILSGDQGVFFSVQEYSGETQFYMGFDSLNTSPAENNLEFFCTDFSGKKILRTSFCEIYENVLPKNIQDSPLPDVSYELPENLANMSNETDVKFQTKVKKIKEAAKNGELWVLNLAHKIKGSGITKQEALKSYERFLSQKKHHCAGVWWTDDMKFVSFSPETFIQQSSNIIDTYPIKGTGTLEYLKNSEKEKSELMMVTDLLRNDLGMIAKKVTVPNTRIYTQEKGFHHAMAHIQAELPTNTLDWETYVKLLPAGSVSGAPKHRVCQYIRDTEAEDRKFYTGTFGVRAKNGSFLRSNILIRTLFFDTSDNWEFPVGGGITYESDPKEEWNETIQKAQALRFVSE